MREAGDRREALAGAGCAARALGAAVLGFYSSGLPGPKGNRESFVWLADGTRGGAATDDAQIRAMALVVEP